MSSKTGTQNVRHHLLIPSLLPVFIPNLLEELFHLPRNESKQIVFSKEFSNRNTNEKGNALVFIGLPFASEKRQHRKLQGNVTLL